MERFAETVIQMTVVWVPEELADGKRHFHFLLQNLLSNHLFDQVLPGFGSRLHCSDRLVLGPLSDLRHPGRQSSVAWSWSLHAKLVHLPILTHIPLWSLRRALVHLENAKQGKILHDKSSRNKKFCAFIHILIYLIFLPFFLSSSNMRPFFSLE